MTMLYTEYDEKVTAKEVTVTSKDAEALEAEVAAPTVKVRYRKEVLLDDRARFEKEIENAEAQIAAIDKILATMSLVK